MLLVAAVGALAWSGSAFLPEFHEGTLTLSMNTMPGTSLAKANEIGRRVEQILLAQPEVVATARRQGRAEYDEHVQGVEGAEIDVGLKETGRPRPELLAELRREFSSIAGTNVVIGQPISHRIDHMLSGTRANIAIKIFGDDLGALRRIGERVQTVVSGVAGVADLSLEQQVDVATIRFVLNREALARYGLRVDDVTRAIEMAFAGTTVGRVFESGISFDLVVKLDEFARADFERISMLPIETADGSVVPISTVASVVREEGPNMVLRENVGRRIVVSCNVAGRDLGSVINDIRASVVGRRDAAGGLPGRVRRAVREPAIRVEPLDAAGLRGAGRAVCPAHDGVRTGSRRVHRDGQPAPGADRRRGRRVCGRRRAERGVHHRVHHAVRHRDAQRHHARLAHPAPASDDEGVTDFRTAVERGASERLIPILMTALAAGLALIPLALGGGRAGSEIQTPMAIVILCGLTTSTLLNMAVVPTLYLRFGRTRRTRD